MPDEIYLKENIIEMLKECKDKELLYIIYTLLSG